MKAHLSENGFTKNFGLLILFVICELLAGVAVVFLPTYWFTLVVAPIVFVIVLSYPMIGISLILISLYFPLLPLVPLGPIEFSATALPAFGLALSAFFRTRSKSNQVSLAVWQKILLAALGLSFLLSSLFSADFSATAKMLPNILIYLLILYGVMAEVNTPDKLKFTVKVLLILTFTLSIWRVELRPLRLLFGLPSLGINGAAFAFHPGVALGLVIFLFVPDQSFSSRWRWFAGVTLVSLLIHGIQYQTRAAWLAWLVMLLVIISRAPLRRWGRFIPLLIIVGLIAGISYGAMIIANYQQTNSTIFAAFGQTNYATINPDDRLRLLAKDAGLRMFRARPLFGWGANSFNFLKPLYVSDPTTKEAMYPGAFNSWLTMLVEIGLVGLLSGLAISLAPLVITWVVLQKQQRVANVMGNSRNLPSKIGQKHDQVAITEQQSEITGLAFGLALGVLGLAIHLLFIDLMFSYYWIHVGLALAAVRLAFLDNSVLGKGASPLLGPARRSDDFARSSIQPSKF